MVEKCYELLLNHIKKLPEYLNQKLIKCVESDPYNSIDLLGGTFILKKIPKRECWQESVYLPDDFKKECVILLKSPNVAFAYDSDTGEEIANNMHHYRMNREELLPEWIFAIKEDLLHLEGLPNLADAQREFIKELKRSAETINI